ncbi:MAG: hypothetical protein WA057_03240 [Candidatus Magasanikiibacteriota bacterium]
MSENGKKYAVEIPNYEPADLGVDFDALLVELRSLKRKLNFERQEIGMGNQQRRVDKQEVEDSFKALAKREHPEETDTANLREIALDKARELVRRIARLVDSKVDTSHEVQFFDHVNDLVDIVSEKITSSSGGVPKEHNYSAVYHPDTDEVEMRKRDFELAQDPFSVIANLTNTGTDDNLQTIKHELIHRKQKKASDSKVSGVSQGIIAITFLGGVANISIKYKGGKEEQDWEHGSILRESQARMMADKRRRFRDLHSDFSKNATYGNRIREQGDWDRLIMAYQQIKELYALGLSEEEITALVVGAEWNSESVSYTNFDERIKAEMAKRGLGIEDVENLVLAEDLKENIKALQVSFITCQELKKLRDRRN